MTTCATKSHEEEADFRVFWPGKSPPPEFCILCADRAMKTAAALGCVVHAEPLAYLGPEPEAKS